MHPRHTRNSTTLPSLPPPPSSPHTTRSISSLIPVKEPGKAAIVPITLGDIEVFSSVRLYLVKDLRTADAQRAVRGVRAEQMSRTCGTRAQATIC